MSHSSRKPKFPVIPGIKKWLSMLKSHTTIMNGTKSELLKLGFSPFTFMTAAEDSKSKECSEVCLSHCFMWSSFSPHKTRLSESLS